MRLEKKKKLGTNDQIIGELHKNNTVIHINVAYNLVAQLSSEQFHSTRDNNVTHYCVSYLYKVYI